MRRVLEAMLRREGYDVITAANGAEALTGMKADVHTVITDLKMPVLDGMALLKKLSAEYPDVPVVMITAHGSVENAVEAVKLGAFDYLEKPFEQEQIRQVVAKAINTYSLARQNARPEEPSGRGRFRLVGQSPAHPADLRGGREGREHAVDRAHHRRIGDRQGADRARAARELVAPRRAVHQDQLRGDPEDADGVGAVRLREGGVHGRGRRQAGAVRAGPRRHAVPRRDRRDPGRDAGEAAARPAGVRVRAGGRHQDHQGRRASGGRDQPRSRCRTSPPGRSARTSTTG